MDLETVKNGIYGFFGVDANAAISVEKSEPEPEPEIKTEPIYICVNETKKKNGKHHKDIEYIVTSNKHYAAEYRREQCTEGFIPSAITVIQLPVPTKH